MAWKLLQYHLKAVGRVNLLTAACYLTALNFIFSFRLLSYQEAAWLSEAYFSICGILVLTVIMQVDHEVGMAELISVKKAGRGIMFLQRFLAVIVILILLFTLLSAYMLFKGSSFPLFELLTGSLITAVYLGLLGTTTAGLTGNLAAGYLLPLGYYLFEYFTAGRYTGEFYIFSLSQGRVLPKYYLLLLIVSLLLFNFLTAGRKSC